MTIAFGIGTAVMGLFYILYTLYANPGSQNEPWWLAFVFGLAFLLGGIAVVIRTLVGPRMSFEIVARRPTTTIGPYK